MDRVDRANAMLDLGTGAFVGPPPDLEESIRQVFERAARKGKRFNPMVGVRKLIARLAITPPKRREEEALVAARVVREAFADVPANQLANCLADKAMRTFRSPRLRMAAATLIAAILFLFC